jgi:hypothetical protein
LDREFDPNLSAFLAAVSIAELSFKKVSSTALQSIIKDRKTSRDGGDRDTHKKNATSVLSHPPHRGGKKKPNRLAAASSCAAISLHRRPREALIFILDSFFSLFFSVQQEKRRKTK